MKDFNIGDRVRVKEYTEISDVNKAKAIKDRPYMWNTGKARLSGKEGVIVDKLFSEAHGRFIYRVQLDGYEKTSNAQFDAESLEVIKEESVTYGHVTETMIKFGEYHLDTLREVSNRLANLANSLPDNRISFAVELSSKPYAIVAKAYVWNGLDIVYMDFYEWYFDRDPDETERKRLELLDKVSEWEEKYGSE